MSFIYVHFTGESEVLVHSACTTSCTSESKKNISFKIKLVSRDEVSKKCKNKNSMTVY